jgi:CHAT domain-containing protein
VIALGIVFALQFFAASTDGFHRAKALEDEGRVPEARAAFEQLVRNKAATPEDQALALTELSRMDLAMGNYPASISRGEDAAARLRFLNDAAAEGNVLTITGLAKMYSADYSGAYDNFQTALKIARAAGDVKQQITRLNNISNVLYFEGRYSDALDVLQEAAKLGPRQLTTANIAIIYQTLGQYDRALDTYAGLRSATDALLPQEQAQLLSNMGALYRRLGDPVKALETYHAARELYRQKELKRGEISVLNNIGIAQAQDLHQPRAAIATFDAALALASGDQLLTLQLTLRRAAAQYDLGQLKEARNDYEKASALADSLHATEEKWKALGGLARLALQSGDPAAAIVHLHEAVSKIESLRGAAPKGLLSEFLADKREVYDLLIKELARAANPDFGELFRLMEMSHSRTLQDTTKPLSLAEVRARLPVGTTLLEYWLGNDSFATLAVSRDHVTLQFSAAQSGLRDRLRTLNKSLSNPASDGWRRDALAITPAPIHPAGHVIIVPDREIALVPFEVLAGFETQIISWLPSASLLPAAAVSRKIIPFWQNTVLALGDPAPNSAAGSFNMPSSRDSRRLPAAVAEVRAIAETVGGRTHIYTGSDATKQNLLAGLRLGFPLVHLATHAFTDPEDAARSYVLLAGANNTQSYDYLFLNEIRNMNLKGVNLISLSACDTELGKLVEGEGVSSLGKALLGSGARAVLTTLWPVGDVPSAAFMEEFYEGLADGLPAATALKQAKTQFARGQFQHPAYWAAFVLNGDPAVTAPRVVRWPVVAGGILFLLALSLFLWSALKKPARKA